jgi:hypothetical protein
LTEDSKNGTGKESKNSSDSDTHKIGNNEGNNNKSREYEESTDSGIISSLKKFTSADDLNPEKPEDNNKKSQNKSSENPKSSQDPEPSKNSNKKVKSPEHDEIKDHEFHFPDLFGQNFIDILKTKKDKIIKVTAILVGGFLVFYGLVLISASTTKVADNVIFGEDATLYAFLVLLGILIIVAAFSQRILEKTSLNKIQSELEVDEGSTESDDSSKKVKDENGNKVDKDNILGDNKK